MAGTVTHSYFAMDVYNKLDNKKIDNYLDNYRTFAQGHDIFTFSNRKSHYYHNTKTQDFFINMINYIEDKKLYNNGEILSYLYGYICHYTLDKNIHPYVTYKGGKYDKKDKNTIKYKGKHADIETYIDTYMIKEKDNIEPGKLKVHYFCCNANKFSDELNDLINYTFKETYNEDKRSKTYYKGIKHMKFLYRLLRYDRFKIKKTMYNAVDKITPKYAYKFSPISLAYKENKDYYLNLEHKTWNHPMDKNEKYNTSVIDIYNDSVEEAYSIINKVTDYFNGKKVDLKKVFDNSSYTTGKDCKIKEKPKYFEY
ncbi:MAG: zinc dependent phospholipase C family protein [Bacilli bacterium]|nr:zinc dependent phospholipase C family protein [Bacilli bacterium]